jgi:hypothetical protein
MVREKQKREADSLPQKRTEAVGNSRLTKLKGRFLLVVKPRL